MGRALAAPAQRLDLEDVHPVGELDQAGAALEELGAEVGEDAEREDVDLQLVDDLGELVDLVAGVELGLVADQVVDPAALGERGDDVAPEVEVRVDLERVVGQAEAAGELRPAPARSWVVKIRPTRPRAAWLWLVWSARVLLPESMVPVKKCSSATGRDPFTDRCRRIMGA